MIDRQEVRQWAMFLHLSQLTGFIIPFAGIIVPILIWQLKKDEMPDLDRHGKIVVNWTISCLIYSFICFILIFVVVGVFLLSALAIVGIVFPIIGGIKASEGKTWKYPLSFTFF